HRYQTLIDIAADHEEIGKQLSGLDDLVARLLELVLRQFRHQPFDQRQMAAAWHRQDADEIVDAARDGRDLAGIGEHGLICSSLMRAASASVRWSLRPPPTIRVALVSSIGPATSSTDRAPSSSAARAAGRTPRARRPAATRSWPAAFGGQS